jgi:hypothetical protein
VAQRLEILLMEELADLHKPPGSSKTFVDALATTTLDAAAISKLESERCFCFIDYEVGDVLLLTPCGHKFHKSCGAQWFKDNIRCPVCRFELPEESIAIHGGMGGRSLTMLEDGVTPVSAS